MIICLLGMKHCGKSTAGRALAERLGWAFADSDDLLVAEAARESPAGTTARDIYRERGVAMFRGLEATGIARRLDARQATGENLVLALGGSTVFNEAIRDRLAASAFSIYLQLSDDELIRRILASGVPAFVTDRDNPEPELRGIIARRAVGYEGFADACLAADGLSEEQVVQAIVAVLRREGVPDVS